VSGPSKLLLAASGLLLAADADLSLHNGRIATVDSSFSLQQAVAAGLCFPRNRARRLTSSIFIGERGLTYISFRADEIEGSFHKVREVLEDRGIISR